MLKKNKLCYISLLQSVKSGVSTINQRKNIMVEETPSVKSFPLIPFITLACCWIFYMYEYVLRVSTAVIATNLMIDFSISASIVGTISAIYYFSYVPLQLPCGIMVDKIGPRKVVTLSAISCTLGCLLFAIGDSIPLIMFGRFLMGAGSACAYMCCLKVAIHWFDYKYFSLIASLSMAMGTAGGIFGGTPLGHIANSYGWQKAIFFLSIAGSIIVVMAWFGIKDKKTAEDHSKKIGFIASIKILSQNKQNWIIGFFGSMMYLPLSAFAELWGVPYFMLRYNITNTMAARASLMVFIGYGLGSILGSLLSEYFENRKKILLSGAVISLISYCTVLYMPGLSFNIILYIMLVFGLSSGSVVLYFTCATESNPKNLSGSVAGMINAIVMISAIAFQPILGFVIDYLWDKTFTAENLPNYTIANYEGALGWVAIALLCALTLGFFIKESFPKFKD